MEHLIIDMWGNEIQGQVFNGALEMLKTGLRF